MTEHLPECIDWYDVDQHPGQDHCWSCLDDDENGELRAFDFLCCCRSEVPVDSVEGIIAFGLDALRKEPND